MILVKILLKDYPNEVLQDLWKYERLRHGVKAGNNDVYVY